MSSSPAAYSYHTPPPKKSVLARVFKWAMALLVILILFVLLTRSERRNSVEIPFSTLDAELNNGKVTKITIGSNEVRGTLAGPGLVMRDGTVTNQFRARVVREASANRPFIQYINLHRGTAEVIIQDSDNLLLQVLLPLLPWAFLFGFIWFFVFRNLRRAQNAAPRAIPVYQVPPPLSEPKASA